MRERREGIEGERTEGGGEGKKGEREEGKGIN